MCVCDGHLVSHPCSGHDENVKKRSFKSKRMTVNISDIRSALVEGFFAKKAEEGVCVCVMLFSFALSVCLQVHSHHHHHRTWKHDDMVWHSADHKDCT